MTSPWLIGLDVDGTIILQTEEMSPGVPEAIAHLRDSGSEVTLATGRSWMATHPFLDLLGLRPEFVVSSNGAVTMRRAVSVDEALASPAAASYERWHVETFDPTVVLELLGEHLPQAQYMVELGSGKRLFTEHLDDWTLDGGRQVTFAELSHEPVSRVVVVAPGHDEADFHRIVEQAGLNDVSYAIGWTAWLDIAPYGVDKGTALERVRDHLGWNPHQVFVAGDGRNDIGMFEWSSRIGGHAIAMGQAPDEVKAAATGVTVEVERGGLALALRALVDVSAEASAASVD